MSRTSSPDVSAAVVELRGLHNLKHRSREKQNEEQDLYRRGDAKFLQEMSSLTIRLKQIRNTNKSVLTFSLLDQPGACFTQGIAKKRSSDQAL